jgi:hypothetical protein
MQAPPKVEEGFFVSQDGNLVVGFEVTLFEEELSPDGLISTLAAFSTAVQQLPIDTMIQKLDSCPLRKGSFGQFIYARVDFNPKKSRKNATRAYDSPETLQKTVYHVG